VGWTIFIVYVFRRIFKSKRGFQWLHVYGSDGSKAPNISRTMSCLSQQKALVLRRLIGKGLTGKHLSVNLDCGPTEQSEGVRVTSVDPIDHERSISDGTVIKVNWDDGTHKQRKSRKFNESSVTTRGVPPLSSLFHFDTKMIHESEIISFMYGDWILLVKQFA
jgi:hypothetical protein